ncbi:ubiquinone biosynthesis regulatory protein kinase UbiB, partial [Vibrio parahaemolyticus]|nr:ubiquinone biosynthesis regulatory protein kinase UbiB [Vibrio parahaemolyticus]
VWETAQPVLAAWMMTQVRPEALVTSLKDRAPFWAENLPELPELLYDSLQQGTAMPQRLARRYQGSRPRQRPPAPGQV